MSEEVCEDCGREFCFGGSVCLGIKYGTKNKSVVFSESDKGLNDTARVKDSRHGGENRTIGNDNRRFLVMPASA